jgi:hypothetical protein
MKAKTSLGNYKNGVHEAIKAVRTVKSKQSNNISSVLASKKSNHKMYALNITISS